MKSNFIPLTVVDVVDMLISGREKLAIDIVNDFCVFRKAIRENTRSVCINSSGKKYAGNLIT